MHVYNQSGTSLYFICSSYTTYIKFGKLGCVTNELVYQCAIKLKKTNLRLNIHVFWSLIVTDEEKD